MSLKDYLEFLYLLQGYLRINVYSIRKYLCAIHEIKSNSFEYLGGLYNLTYKNYHFRTDFRYMTNL